MRVAGYSASYFESRRTAPPHPQTHPQPPVAVLGLQVRTEVPHSIQASIPDSTTSTYSLQSPTSSPAAVNGDPPLAARSSPSSRGVYIPARMGLFHVYIVRSGFVEGYNRLVAEGSSAAGSYSQRNHIASCAMFHPPSVPSNSRTAEPRDVYLWEPIEIASIPVYPYYCL